MKKLSLANLQEGLADLEELSAMEYGQELSTLLTKESARLRIIQVGRLMGVVLRDSFSWPTDLEQPDPDTEARRSWTLSESAAFYEDSDCWQYKVLIALLDEQWMKEELATKERSPYSVAEVLQETTGFFGAIAQSCSKSICRAAKVRDNLTTTLETLPADEKPTPARIIDHVGEDMAAALLKSSSILRKCNPAVLTGMILILAAAGVKGFCDFCHGGVWNAPNEK